LSILDNNFPDFTENEKLSLLDFADNQRNNYIDIQEFLKNIQKNKIKEK
jgi:hypothetical protein